ncbi:MAG: BamA/TamA family outer membrane protein [Spirochaetota bacterium]|nr:BamA/TamA family outer membrane protein [Spirochaetota bacterium]
MTLFPQGIVLCILSLYLVLGFTEKTYSGIKKAPISEENKKKRNLRLNKKKKYNDMVVTQFNGLTIKKIVIKGTYKTRRSVILTILKIKEGDIFDPDLFREGIQRLRNTDTFYMVRYRVKMMDTGGVKILLRVKDKWTILPVIAYNSGGGITQIRLGVYDSNFFGTFKEVGGVYQNLNGEHYGYIYYGDNYFLETHIRFRVSIFTDGFTDSYYGPNDLRYLLLISRRSGVNNELHFPIIQDFITFSFASSIHYEVIDKEDYLKDPAKNPFQYYSFLSKELFMVKILGQLSIGKVNLLEDYYFSGWKIMGRLDMSNEKFFSDESYLHLRFDAKLFHVLFKDISMGYHLAMWKSFTDLFYRDFYMGGFNNLRAFLGTQFHGENLYFANVELRVPFYKGQLWVIPDFVSTFVTFFDIGYIWDGQYFSSKLYEDFYADVGFGFRFKVRRIKQGEFRIDFAYSVHPHSTETVISTGLSHFF